ncbi:MAG TPA: membrane protein insertase YidC [Terriglobales bacterium]|nr:membrane protein insertase YidC [Terriglobales bacterium]
MPEFQNPNQEPGMERRLLIVFALTFLVIIVCQPLLKKYLPQTVTPPAQTQKQEASPVAASNPSVAPPSPVVPIPTGSKQASTESETVIENDLYRITFTNHGGLVKSWILKKYDDDKGQPLDLVNSVAAEKYGYPLSLWTYDEGQRNKINSALYVGSQDTSGDGRKTLTFEYADQDLTVKKSFRFNESYVVDIETSVLSKGNVVSALPVWPAGFGDESTTASYAASRIEYHNEESTERSYLVFPSQTQRLAIKAVSSGNTVPGPFNWIGVVDQYFAAVFIPQDPHSTTTVYLRNSIDIPKDLKKPNPQETQKVEVLGTAVGNLHGPTVERIFVGPKSLRILEAVSVPGIADHADLRDLVNFGFFGIIARPLFIWLQWTYQHIVANWGWAIVFQTLIISLALLPLRISSMKSALKMQKIQPQMNAIKDKYKKYGVRDPRRQEMNVEIGSLMKSEGVNPVGGCLPMVIQMPFLFAYYSMLNSTLDLRHASWLWISDLSSADPWHLLPITLVLSMIITQRMTPQAGMDPQQQKMMNVMMPVMMGFIFFNLAAGVTLYYMESNLVSIVQQVVMNRTSLGKEMREMALKRAKKKEKGK